MKRLIIISLLGLVSSTGISQDGDPLLPVIRSIGEHQEINCLSAPVALTFSIDHWQDGFTYQWSTGATDSVIHVQPTSTEDYSVTISHLDLGISHVEAYQVVVANDPITVADQHFSIDKQTCSGSDLTIHVDPVGGHGDYRYAWSFGSLEKAPTIQPEASSSFTVSITDECGSQATANVTVELEKHDPLEVNSVHQITYSCANEELELKPELQTVQGGVGYGYSYAFDGLEANTPLVIIPEEKKLSTYFVEITDACGDQVVTQKIELILTPLEKEVPPALFTCASEPIELVKSDDGFYFWDGNAMKASHKIIAKRSRTYDIQYIDECGIEQKTTRKVEVENFHPEIDLDINHLDKRFYAFALDINGLSNYSWYLNGELISNEDNIEVNDLESIENELVFEGISDLGCSYEQRRSITFQDGVQIPTAISPNGDGLNETFRMRFEDELAYFHVTIFDRWGHKIFESRDQHFEWTPHTAEMVGPIGTFAYVLKAQTQGGKSIEKTSVLTTINAH